LPKKTGFLIAAAVVIIILLGVIFIQPAIANLGLENQGSQGIFDPFKVMIQGLEAQLRGGKIQPPEREALEKKLESVGVSATQRAEGLALRQSGKAPQRTITPLPIPPVHRLPDGIDENPVIPTTAKSLIFTNAWRKITAERNYLIYAGALRGDPAQGIVYVQNPKNFGFYVRECPSASGSLKIINEENLRLTLEASNGETFYFDARREIFVDANGNPLSGRDSATAYPVP
jgi:hypothetical protein